MIPQRPSRGADLPQEAQFQPLYRALDRGIAGDNIAAQAIMPVGVAPGATGGVLNTNASHIAWAFQTVSFAFTAAGTASATITHSLGRTPIGIIPLAQTWTQIGAIIASNVSAWTTDLMTIGFNAPAAMTITASFIVL